MKTSFPVLAPAGLVLALLLAGCGRGMGDLEEWVAEVKARKSTAIEPIPQMKQFEPFAYEAGDRRDPFEAAQAQDNTASDGPMPDQNRNREPLEEFPLDSLRMLGVISSAGRTYAMVKAPDGVVHRVTLKDHLGQNYGEITGITETEVSLLEWVPDGFGGWIQRPATLALQQQ